MGERTGRTLFATATTLALLLSSIGGAATVAAVDACDASGSPAPGPPDPAYAEFPAVVIHVKWDHVDDALLKYIVTASADPMNDPFSGIWAAMGAGCNAKAIICGQTAPLILTDASVSGPNQASLTAGHYTIVAAPGGACAYYTGKDGRPEYATAPKEIAVTATIESYGKGAKASSLSKTFEPVMVETFEEPPIKLGKYRRILGTFDWDPATGVSNVKAAGAKSEAQTADLGPLPWWMGTLVAAGPLALDSATADGPATKRPGVAERMFRDLGPTGALFVLLLLAVDEMRKAIEGDNPLSARFLREYVATALIFIAEATGRGPLPAPPQPSAVVPPPPVKQPSGDLYKYGRYQWVYVSKPVPVADERRGDRGLRKLKPGRWYQAAKQSNGSWKVRKKNGDVYGWTSPIDEGFVWPRPASKD